MTRVVLDIPDNEVEEFLKYVRNFSSTEIEISKDFLLDQKMIELLDQSSAVSIEKCISREQLRKRLENAV